MVRTLAAAALAALVAAGGTWAQTAPALPAPHPLAARLAGAAEPLPLDDLVDGALVFSGTADSELPVHRRRLLALVAGFQVQAAANADPRVLAARALEYLHAAVLRRYDARQARVDVLLDAGAYNCVSSSVMYLVLCRSVGLTVAGVRTADHAFCAVRVGGSTVDVETTNPYGFDPGTRKEFTDSFGRVTGFAYVPPSNYRDRVPVDERGLLSLILYDRVAFAADRADYAAALEPAVSAYALAGDELSRTTLLTAIENYEAWLGMAGRYEDALSFLEDAEHTLGGAPELIERRRETLHNQAVALVEAGRFDEAERLLASSPRADILEPSHRTELLVWTAQVRADRSAREGDFAAAAAVVADGIVRLGPDPQLLGAFESYTHNAAAKLYNARRFAEARSLLEAALARYPQSRVIRQDLEDTRKALQR